MKITLLGTGTSQGIPVIGCPCDVCLSNDLKDKRLRVACKIEQDNTTIVIDIGPDFRQQMLRSNTQNLSAVLLTHEHNDHTAGLDDLRSFNFSQNMDMPIFTSQQVIEDIRQRFAYTFAKNRYPGTPRFEWNIISHQEDFFIKKIKITPIKIWHGQLPILGFRIGDFAYLTDVKSIPEEEFDKLQNIKVLILSALHFGEHHAHLNVPEALALIEKIKPEQTYLSHISHAMGLHEDINSLLPKNVALAFDGLEIEL